VGRYIETTGDGTEALYRGFGFEVRERWEIEPGAPVLPRDRREAVHPPLRRLDKPRERHVRPAGRGIDPLNRRRGRPES